MMMKFPGGGDKRSLSPHQHTVYMIFVCSSIFGIFCVFSYNSIKLWKTVIKTSDNGVLDESLSSLPMLLEPRHDGSEAGAGGVRDRAGGGGGGGGGAVGYYDDSGLLNKRLIRSKLLAEAPWAESHGADHNYFLGAGMLYYSWAYAMQSQTIVVLGSGGGFVPRMLRQAQRDLEWSGVLPAHSKGTQLYLIDAHLPQAGWGSTFYAHNPESLMAKEFPDITYMFELTDVGFEILKRKNVTIDYLHIDADHSFAQSWKDFENYFSLLSSRGVVSFHDTCFIDGADGANMNCNPTGVHDTMVKLKSEAKTYGLQVMDAHYLYNGIAFAIRERTKNPLPVSHLWDEHFCRNNLPRLQANGSAGFTHDGLGAMGTLGDFVDCNRKLQNPTTKPCPTGTFRRHHAESCRYCLPGMTGDDCRTLQYQTDRLTLPNEQRNQKQTKPTTRQTKHGVQVLRLMAAWLEERKSQRILEWGLVMPSGQSLMGHWVHNDPRLFVLIDPLVEEPVWLDDIAQGTATRLLPCKLLDVIYDKANPSKQALMYQSALWFNHMDTFVCTDCDRRIPQAPTLSILLNSVIPRVKTIILEGSSHDDDDDDDEEQQDGIESLDRFVQLLTSKQQSRKQGKHTLTSWHVESDMEIRDRSTDDKSRRRLIFLSKRNTPLEESA